MKAPCKRGKNAKANKHSKEPWKLHHQRKDLRQFQRTESGWVMQQVKQIKRSTYRQDLNKQYSCSSKN